MRRVSTNRRRIGSALRATIVAWGGLFAGACSSRPSETDAEQVLRAKIGRESEGRIRLVGFKKMDGMEREFFGVKMFELEYRADIEFLEACKWIINPLESGFRTVKPVQAEGFTWDGFLQDLEGGVGVKKGERKTIFGSVTYEKAEKGWRLASLRVGPG